MAFAAKDSKTERYGSAQQGTEFFDRRTSGQRYVAMNFSDGATKKKFPWGAQGQGRLGPERDARCRSIGMSRAGNGNTCVDKGNY